MAKQSSLFRFFGSPPAAKKSKNKAEKKIEKTVDTKNPKIQSPAKLSKPKKKITPSPPVASRKSSIKRKATPTAARTTESEIAKKEVTVPKKSDNDGLCDHFQRRFYCT